MKIKYTELQRVQKEYEVPDEYGVDSSVRGNLVDVILGKSAKEIRDSMYGENIDEIKWNAGKLKEAYRIADECIQAIREGKFDI